MLQLININLNLVRQLYDIRYFATRSQQRATLKKLYQILDVAEDCDDETLKVAFVQLAKTFHPDSGTAEADAYRFSEIESAYRKIQHSRNADRNEQYNSDLDVEEFDIKHIAPQHRHYLAYDVGFGTPSMRQRRYAMERAQKAVENVMEHRLKRLQATERNSLVGMDKHRAKDIKTRYGVDRLVEDLIQEAMNKGEFSNLSGMGKPLKNDACAQNPYVDFITHKLNKIMIDNGFTPEWIQLSKEIREEVRDLQNKLTEARNTLGETPLICKDKKSWENTLEKLKLFVEEINKKIDKYNLLVPVLQKQMLRVDLRTFADAALDKTPVKMSNKSSDKISSTIRRNEETIIDTVFSFFSKKKI